MKTGSKVWISPDLTYQNDWIRGTVIEVEKNPFIGLVISAKTEDGVIYFGKENMFSAKKPEACLQ